MTEPDPIAEIPERDDEREDWARLALECLERAYGDAEPSYSLDSIKQWNPDYRDDGIYD